MDRSRPPAPDHFPAVRSAELAAFYVLLRAAAGERGESAPAPAARRTVYAAALLWQPSHGGGTEGEPQTHAAADADSGNRSHPRPPPPPSPRPSETRRLLTDQNPTGARSHLRPHSVVPPYNLLPEGRIIPLQ